MNSRTAERLNDTLAAQVGDVVASSPVIDIHTHLYDPAFGDLLLWGIDEMLIYHYLVAEAFRYTDMPFQSFWELPKARQAEFVWDTLFLRHSPVSEACRGVLTTLHALGLDPKRRDLPTLREWFKSWKREDYVSRCLDLAGVQSVCMTNSPFDLVERQLWEMGISRDSRFSAALRIDPLLVAWGDTAPLLTTWGYEVGVGLTEKTISEVRRFLHYWTEKMRARYLMVSLGPEFAFPSDHFGARLLEKAVLPHCRDHGLTMALMLGVKRGVNPELRLAGDGVGLSNLAALEHLCRDFPSNKFMVTVLSRENQHELCVLGRKFRNLHIFGCWWFTNIPSLISEITRMRLESLGLSFTAQHSDARVVDQLIYKWRHVRSIVADVLTAKYRDMAATGWEVSKPEIQRDVADLFGGSFARFCRC